MSRRESYDLPDEKRRLYERGLALEWWTLFFMGTITLLIYLTMGASQAMKAAWVEDVLSMLPPIAILVAAHYRDRPASEDFPYGYHGSIQVAFLLTAVVLLVLGGYILVDSAHGLLTAHHPTIGTKVLFGHQVWAGWLMIAVLSYSIVPPMVLGRMKLPIARETHDKALHADADINKADWLTGGAGILGILGIGAGLWWADSVAALVISVDIVLDGLKNLKRVTADILQQRPTSVAEGEPLDLDERIRRSLTRLPWIEDAAARLREEGHVVVGETFVVPRGGSATVEQVGEAREAATEVDWRLHDLVVTLVDEVSEEGEAREGK